MSQGERRLAAIMYTDMVGYTALGQRNESLSLALVYEQRKLLRPIFDRHNGKEIKTMGDSFLVEFPSALDAVRCAYDIQRAAREFNVALPSEKRVHLRVGVHLGDVVESQGDISGDAVNVASRIEPLAEDGGVCLTRQVYDHVQNKFELPVESLGSRPLKNVAVPVEVFKMVMPWDEAKSVFDKGSSRARVAVLPFENISPDPADSYFADGMTEELIDRLSQVRELKVIARTSVMSYRKKEKKASEIGKELGVGSLVEGSVRKAGDRIRVTAQLIDAITEEHMWSSRYDNALGDIFGVQTDIASKITSELAGTLVVQQTPKMLEDATKNVTAYSYFLQAKQLQHEDTKDSLPLALQLLDKAIQLDPSFSRAYTLVAWCYAGLIARGILPREEAIGKAKSAAQKALKLDSNLSEAHEVLAGIAAFEDENDTLEKEAGEATRLNPNNPNAQYMLGLARAVSGHLAEATKILEAAYLLDPLAHWIISELGCVYLYSGRQAEALEFWTKNLPFARRAALSGMAGVYLIMGDYNTAEKTITSLEQEFPEEMFTTALRGEIAALGRNRESAEKAIQLLGTRFRETDGVEFYMGTIKYFLGDVDGFYEELFRAVEKHSQDTLRLRYSPLFERARQDPRYREVMMKINVDPESKE
jgi:adenylate cyclase